jgi:hypothetical protein
MSAIRNIFACLVHESPECIIDLVRNLRALDPDSLLLLYNGSNQPDLLHGSFPFERYNVVLHPSPRPAQWGRLHQFALDCMEWACDNYPFDTLTIVDSDQLAIRAGYSSFLAAHIQGLSNIGVLGSSAGVQGAGTRIGPAELALREIDLWRPLLREFQNGEEKFVHWCFWPSTIFTADASRNLTRLFATNSRLQAIMLQTRIWASEELILPTMVALLGYTVATSPCSYEYVKYRVPFSLPQLQAAFRRDNAFWMHPVPRRYDDPLRTRIRERWNHYELAQSKAETRSPAAMKASETPRLLLTLPILAQMRAIEGWLEEAEADLLIAAVTRAVAAAPKSAAVVEIGSFCGRSTVVIGGALNAIDDAHGVKLYAIDPHDGIVGALDQGVKRMPPTLEKFQLNISNAGLNAIVENIPRRSFEVPWDRPISLLFIDGLHDYVNVARDFYHFEESIVPGGLVGFHDYADYYPGVKGFVDELLADRRYQKVHLALSLMLVRKRTAAEIAADDDTERIAVAAHAETTGAPAIIAREPLVSCIMPTANRRAFVPQAIHYFLQQDYPNRELIILDDGSEKLADLVPTDNRIRYQRMDRQYTMGAKHNMACALARGEVVVHWDDDDWMANWRISYQVDSLLAHSANTICGLAQLFFFDPRTERAWEYVYPMINRPWLAGATFCYRREFWESHRHPDMNEGSDTAFVWGLRDANVCALEKSDFYVAIIHPKNTSPKRTNDPAWRSIEAQKIHSLIDSESSFYRSLRAPH